MTCLFAYVTVLLAEDEIHRVVDEFHMVCLRLLKVNVGKKNTSLRGKSLRFVILLLHIQQSFQLVGDAV